MKVPRRNGRKARIEMLPLIDIVFLLLVFFIQAMLSMAVHRGLPVNLPSSTSAEIEKKLIIAVTVKADGSLFIDHEAVSEDNFGTVMKQRAEGEESPGVLLFADRGLPYQLLFRVLDQLRQVGIQRISLQAELEPAP